MFRTHTDKELYPEYIKNYRKLVQKRETTQKCEKTCKILKKKVSK